MRNSAQHPLVIGENLALPVDALPVVRLWWAEHRTLLGFCLGYVAVVSLILRVTVDQSGELATLQISGVLLALVGAWLGTEAVVAFANCRPLGPVLARVPGALTVAILTPLVTTAFSSWKQAMPILVPFTWDPWLHAVSVGIHGRPEWEWFRWVYAQPSILRAVDTVYSIGWVCVTLTTLVWMACSVDRSLRQRYFLTFALVIVLLGSVLALLLGSGGPVLYHLFAPAPATYRELWALLTADPTLVAPQAVGYLVEAHGNALKPLGGISAMPSLHVAHAMLTALVLWPHGRWGQAAGIGWVGMILLGSVILGWHYAIDGYVSIAATLLLWRLSARMTPATVNHAVTAGTRSWGRHLPTAPSTRHPRTEGVSRRPPTAQSW